VSGGVSGSGSGGEQHLVDQNHLHDAAVGISSVANRTVISRNTFEFVWQPIDSGGREGSIDNNDIRNARFYGIVLGGPASGQKVRHNTISGPTHLPACQDRTSGRGTAGTANWWLANLAPSSDPLGLCG
jgi:hypothetical protein